MNSQLYAEDEMPTIVAETIANDEEEVIDWPKQYKTIIGWLIKLDKVGPSYGRFGGWISLSPGQRNKVIKAWNEVPLEQRSNFVAEMNKSTKEAKSRVTANDKIRLVHLSVDPRHAELWRNALYPLPRVELDDKETRNGSWEQIAVEFNDYTANVYTNATCNLVNGTCIGPQAHKAVAHNLCCGWNPCDESRPKREFPYLQNMWRQLKADYRVIYDNYTRSGHQDASEDPDAAFQHYIHGDKIAMYVFVMVPDADSFLEKLGDMPRELRKDTAVLGETNVTPAKRKKSSSVSSPSSSLTPALAPSVTVVHDFPKRNEPSKEQSQRREALHIAVQSLGAIKTDQCEDAKEIRTMAFANLKSLLKSSQGSCTLEDA